MPYYSGGKNNLKLDQNVGENNNRTIMKATEDPDSNKEGNITFGTNNVKINAASVTADDSKKNKWTITTVGTTSFTPQPTYSQVGSKSSPATSITFTCTLPDKVIAITSCSIQLGGFDGTAGAVSIKFGETGVGTGNLNAKDDVTVTSTKFAYSNMITISITGIDKGVKVYSINYKYATSNSEIAKANINSSDTKAQLKYSFVVPPKEGVSSLEKVITEPTDWRGNYLIVCKDCSVAFDGSLPKLDAVSNTKKVTISDDKIEAQDGMIDFSFKIEKSGEKYTIKSASDYYIGQTTNDNGLKISSDSTAYTNKISWNDNGSINIVSGGAYLRYNPTSGQTRFRYFKSATYTVQKEIYLYKLPEVTKTNYSFSNMKMNLGAVIEVAKVQALVDAKLSISSYGVAVAQKSNLGEYTISDAVSKNSSYVGIVSKPFTTVDAMQKTDASGTATSGDYVIFNADLSFPDESKYNVEVSAVAFFKLEDETYLFFQERTLSVASLAKLYIEKTDVYNNYDSDVQGSLKALAAIPASVA